MNKSTAKRVISIVITALLILCTFVCFVAVLKVTISSDPSIFGYRCFYIVTGSMEPNVPVGSVLITKEQSEYEVGDVITFQSNDSAIAGSPNTHRIIAIETDADGNPVYRTKGDANRVPDAEGVAFDAVYGKMVFLARKTAWVSVVITFLTSPAGFLCIIVIPLLLITVLSMKDYLKTLKKSIADSATGSGLSPDASQREADSHGEEASSTEAKKPDPKSQDKEERS